MIYAYNSKNELASITTGSTTYSFTYDALGRMSAYTNDNIRYYYTPDGKLSSMMYGSGEFEYIYTYDELGRLIEERCYYTVTEEWEEDGEIYYDWYEVIEPIKKYEYTADGKLYRIYDVLNDEYTHYSYDVSGRLEHVIRYKSDKLNDFSVNYYYSSVVGKEHLLSSQFYFFNYSAGNETVYGQMWYDYDYNDDDSLKELEVSSGEKRADLTYTYDDFKRPSTVTLVGKSYENYSYVDSGFTSTTTYGYETSYSGVTTGEISTYTVRVGNSTNTYTYTYDGRGNILIVELNGDLIHEYAYDDLGQLEWEEDFITGECYAYYYDNAGNMVYRVDGMWGTEYYYDYDGDRLISFNGESITYDEFGRTTYYRGKAITYYEYDFNRIHSIGGISFTYDAEGMRASKTVNGVTHYYTYDGINLIREEWGNNTLVFLYDANGSPIGMQYRTTSYDEGEWDTYYYEKNLQGDILAVYSASGTKLVSYYYDSWGYISDVTYSNGGGNTSARYNPLKYRGYYYDDDLDLYYLATRYYDPETCRFVTADDPSYLGANGDLVSYNLYAYCSNNPVMYSDPTGHSITAAIIIGAIVGITIAFAATAYTDYVDDGEVFNGSVDAVDYAANMVVGGTVGGLVGYASPAIGAFLTTNFTFGAPALVAGGEAVAVTVSGAQIIGSVTLAGVVINAVSTKNSNGYWGQKYSNDHSPEHIHLKGPNTNIRIGIDGNPLKGEPTLNSQQRKALKKLWREFANLFEKP